MLEPVSDSLFASVLSAATVAESGSNPKSTGVPPFSSLSQAEQSKGHAPALILLVEDNRADVMLIKEAIHLRGLAVELRVLDNGEAGCQFIESVDRGEETVPDLLILDLNLPRRSGKEVLLRLRQSENYASIPVLIVTSSTLDEPEMKRLGADDYFQKPTDYEAFMTVGKVIESILRPPAN